jgi:hypothetical protein
VWSVLRDGGLVVSLLIADVTVIFTPPEASRTLPPEIVRAGVEEAGRVRTLGDEVYTTGHACVSLQEQCDRPCIESPILLNCLVLTIDLHESTL